MKLKRKATQNATSEAKPNIIMRMTDEEANVRFIKVLKSKLTNEGNNAQTHIDTFIIAVKSLHGHNSKSFTLSSLQYECKCLQVENCDLFIKLYLDTYVKWGLLEKLPTCYSDCEAIYRKV